MKLVHMLVTVAFFTASCDVVLVTEAVGTLRLAQLMMVLVIVLALARIVQTQRVLWPAGGTALMVWLGLQFALLSRSKDLLVSFEILVLTSFLLLGIYAVLQLYGESIWVERLLKMYLQSYVAIAVFGLIQFVSPALHLGAPYVVQWIKHGVIPRISGFNYEPSYFATYLMIGFITLVDLRASKARITADRRWLWATILTGSVLFLSTSKTAWLIMAVELMARLMPLAWRLLEKQTRRLLRGSLLVPLPRVRILLALVLIVVTAAAGLSALSRVINLNIFLSGTGLNGSAAHSLNDRTRRFGETLTVVRDNPWLGPSQGGVAGEIAEAHGTLVRNATDLRKWWGYPVPVEVLAGSGVIGFIPFLWFFLTITAGNVKLIRERWGSDERAKWLRALVRALIFEWLMLLADQNLLRVYLWFHVTMVVVVAYSLRYGPGSRAAMENVRRRELQVVEA